ncbi:hypothetical protein HU200_058733 [Digitaria exilis]|uniref:DUF295 domain-containing protein n=1 Tax=Digitaria exilis TaxID=1010633 RepID=A0A835A980_9POAL|nr:hypothetical protein HU200_058733 [Digitaria exilis]
MAAALPSSWEELPPELLGLVLHRLPSLGDRVRLRAVCRPWRAGALVQRQQEKPLPPPLPYRAVDDLAFLVHDDGGCSLVNPLSGFTLDLPELAPAVHRAIDGMRTYYNHSHIRKAHVKAILSSPVESTPDPLVAVLILEGFSVVISACKQHKAINVRMSPGRNPGLPAKIHDIAFFQEKLYALTGREGLYAVELRAGSLGGPDLSSGGFHRCITEDPDQLPIYDPREHQIYTVEPEMTLNTWVPGRWMKVDSLGGHAIFLGSECTKSVLASQCAGGVQEDCVYFMHRIFDNPAKEFLGPCVDPLADSGVYNVRDGRITPLLPEGVMVELRRKRQYLTWFFPVDA